MRWRLHARENTEFSGIPEPEVTPGNEPATASAPEPRTQFSRTSISAQGSATIDADVGAAAAAAADRLIPATRTHARTSQAGRGEHTDIAALPADGSKAWESDGG